MSLLESLYPLIPPLPLIVLVFVLVLLIPGSGGGVKFSHVSGVMYVTFNTFNLLFEIMF